jgi:hypothetical protein
VKISHDICNMQRRKLSRRILYVRELLNANVNTFMEVWRNVFFIYFEYAVHCAIKALSCHSRLKCELPDGSMHVPLRIELHNGMQAITSPLSIFEYLVET